jgi:hypothetical protein
MQYIPHLLLLCQKRLQQTILIPVSHGVKSLKEERNQKSIKIIKRYSQASSMSRFKNLNLCCLDMWIMIGRTMLKQMGWSTFVHIAASQISVRNLRKPLMDINEC